MIGAFVGSVALAILLHETRHFIHLHPFLCVVLPFLLIGGTVAVRVWVETRATEYRLTTQRFFVKRGLIARRLDEVELFRVKDVTVRQSIVQRILGYGDVTVLSTDDSTPMLVMTSIADPMGAKERLRTAYRAARRREGVMATEFIPS
jgi:uncharacterized membrane protein YdbT with pleckstrin-like domain